MVLVGIGKLPGISRNGRGVSGSAKEKTIFQVGALYGGITFAGTLDHQYVWVGKGGLRPTGEGKHFSRSLIVIRGSNCFSLQLL